MSLLDWLTAHLAQPDAQRVLRFGLALLALGWGAYAFTDGNPLGGFIFTGAAFGLGAWGLAVRGRSTAIPIPTVSDLGAGGEAAPHTTRGSAAVAAPALSLETFAALRLPAALLLAVAGQWIFTYQRQFAFWGYVCYASALVAFLLIIRRSAALREPRAAEIAAAAPVSFRLWLLLGALAAAVYAFARSGNNLFRGDAVIAWLVSIAAWLGAVWEGAPDWAAWRARAAGWLRQEAFTPRVSRATLLLLAVLAVGAYFRFARLESVPPEMTSDHVEKLLDVSDLLSGPHKIFFERNTGREPLEFYAAALVIQLFGTGLTHLTLKIVTATAGFLMLPFVYWLGREIEDETLGLLAALAAALSFWATAISRVGLRFPLTPLFIAPVLFFMLRGLRRGARNDLILSGLALGAGLYGYSTFRVAPIAVIVLLMAHLLRPAARGRRGQAITHALLLAVTALIVFVPLLRYAVDVPEMFWYRTLSRLSDTEQIISGSPLVIFLLNNWKALRVFNWLGDIVWVNTVPGIPLLDFVSGALFLLGAAFLVWRLLARRDWLGGLLLVLIPVLMLPSTLNLAFPTENPSAVRQGAAIPVAALVVAYPLWALVKHLRAHSSAPGAGHRRLAGLTVGGLLLVSAAMNYDLYFNQYPVGYRNSAENASELGAVIHDFAHSIGSYDRAFVRPFPYWVDTRAVEMYAGNFGADAAVQAEDLGEFAGDPLPKLFIVHTLDLDTVTALRQLYPTGRLSLRRSTIPGHDFLVYFVPGTLDFDANTLPAS